VDEATALASLVANRSLPLAEIDAIRERLRREQADRPSKDSTSEKSGFHERFGNRGFNVSEDLNDQGILPATKRGKPRLATEVTIKAPGIKQI
jgi:hypothetical protein